MHCIEQNWLTGSFIPLLSVRPGNSGQQWHQVCRWENSAVSLCPIISLMNIQNIQELNSRRKENIFYFISSSVFSGVFQTDSVVNFTGDKVSEESTYKTKTKQKKYGWYFLFIGLLAVSFILTWVQIWVLVPLGLDGVGPGQFYLYVWF